MSITKKGKTYIARAFWRSPSGKRQSQQQAVLRTQSFRPGLIDKIVKKNKGPPTRTPYQLILNDLFDDWHASCIARELSLPLYPNTDLAQQRLKVSLAFRRCRNCAYHVRNFITKLAEDADPVTQRHYAIRKAKKFEEEHPEEERSLKEENKKLARLPRAENYFRYTAGAAQALEFAIGREVIEINPALAKATPEEKHFLLFMKVLKLVDLLKPPRKQEHKLYFPCCSPSCTAYVVGESWLAVR